MKTNENIISPQVEIFLHSCFDYMSLNMNLHSHTFTHIHTHSHPRMNATNFNLVSLQSTILSDFLTFSLSFSAETWQVLLPTPIFYFIAKTQKSLSFISWDLPSTAISPLFHLVSSFRNKSTLLGKADSVHLHVH